MYVYRHKIMLMCAKYIAFKPMCLEIAVLLYSLAVYIYVFYIAITDTSFATNTATNTYSNAPCSLNEQLMSNTFFTVSLPGNDNQMLIVIFWICLIIMLYPEPQLFW